LLAWIMPTWIFCLATMMLPRPETRRETVTGSAGRAGQSEDWLAKPLPGNL
jgi:hypothetical protein